MKQLARIMVVGLVALVLLTSDTLGKEQRRGSNQRRQRSDSTQDTEALKKELSEFSHKLIFEAYDVNNWELFIINPDGTGKRKLTKTPSIHEHYPQASPDGKHICFVAEVGQGREAKRSIWVMDPDGENRKLVAERGRQPCWSSDGKKIAFMRPEYSSRFSAKGYATKGLFFYDLASGKTTQHPSKRIAHIYNLTWSADGKWIAAIAQGGGMGYRHGIIAIEVEGDRTFELRIGGCRPTFSPDGKKITWSSGDRTISVGDVDYSSGRPRVSNVKRVDSRSTSLYHPDFSPDGKYISYSIKGRGNQGYGGRYSGRSGRRGSNRNRTVDPGTHSGSPQLVGVRGNWDIYVKRADGRGPSIRLTNDGAMSNKESDWLPMLDAQDQKDKIRRAIVEHRGSGSRRKLRQAAAKTS